MTQEEFLTTLNQTIRREAGEILERFHCSDALDMVSEGKRLRALLVYSLTENASEKTVLAAAAIELLHASTLVHDDIIDEASTRRGRPTISRAHSVGTAIMVGNAIFARAVELARRSMSARLQAEFHELYISIAAAQNDELLWRGELRSEEIYHAISYGKTGLLFEFCARLAAGHVAAYQEIVARIAYAFQIVDDIDDVLMWRGETRAHASKLAEFDIELGNITLPIILAFEHTGITNKNFTNMGDIGRLKANDWSYGIENARMRAATLVVESRKLLAEIDDSGQKQRFSTWAEPMMRQLEAKSITIDELHV